MNHDTLIKNLFWNSNSNNVTQLYRRFMQKSVKYNNIVNYLRNRFNDSESIYETVLRIGLNVTTRPTCPICENKLNFIGKPNSKGLYSKYCSMSCRAKDNHSNYNNIDKAKQTKLEKYGDENYNNPQKRYLTKLEKYGNGYYVNRQQGVQTYIVNHPKIKIIDERTPIEKSKDTRRKKYGDENYNNISKYKETCKSKYGVEHWSKSKIGKLSLSNILSSKEIRDKVYITKKNHDSFNKSTPENESYSLLLSKFTEVIRQYKSNVYPFSCDFYIPYIDTYIECNYFWTHGGYPYIETEQQCKDKLDYWKSKNSKFFDNAIYTWTDLDVRKRNIAKQNNLNFIEFWNISELKKWIETYDNRKS